MGETMGEANLLNAPLFKRQRDASTLCLWGLLWGEAALPLPAGKKKGAYIAIGL